MADTENPDLPESVRRWMARVDDERDRCEQASSVAAIAEMAGIPKWKVFKVVAGELEQKAMDALGKREKDETLVAIITESISYACELTREDGWHTVWPKRRLADLKQFLKDYCSY